MSTSWSKLEDISGIFSLADKGYEKMDNHRGNQLLNYLPLQIIFISHLNVIREIFYYKN